MDSPLEEAPFIIHLIAALEGSNDALGLSFLQPLAHPVHMQGGNSRGHLRACVPFRGDPPGCMGCSCRDVLREGCLLQQSNRWAARFSGQCVCYRAPWASVAIQCTFCCFVGSTDQAHRAGKTSSAGSILLCKAHPACILRLSGPEAPGLAGRAYRPGQPAEACNQRPGQLLSSPCAGTQSFLGTETLWYISNAISKISCTCPHPGR